MPAIEALSGAAHHASDRAQRHTDQHRSAGGLLSARLSPTGHWQIALGPEHRNAVATAFNRGCSWARASERGGAARHQPGHHRRALLARVGLWPGRRFGAAGRFAATPTRGTDAAVNRAVNPACGARTGR